MRKYFVEFVGTFFLVLTVCAAASKHMKLDNFAPLGVGLAFAVMIYAGHRFSGAHYNPAISLAMFLRKKMSMAEMIGYWVAQLIAGVMAALIASKLFEYSTVLVSPEHPVAAVFAELLGTFALVYVVLNVYLAKKDNNHYFGLAIGFTLVAMAFAVSSVSGGAFNPAVALGLGVFQKLEWNSLWMYVTGAVAGAIVAVIVFRIFRFDTE